MTDPELIEGILKCERTAFQYLVIRYQRGVIKTAFHFLGNMEDAEDLSQEIFLEIIRSIHTFRNSSTLETWIYRITVNRSLNQLKKNKRRGFLIRLESIIGFSGNHSIPEPYANETSLGQEEKENKKMLHDAINKLPENQRIAFVLHKFDDQAYKQVAEIMNLSLAAVESLIHRAKSNLHTQLIAHFPEYKKN
ncbi:MAG: RNA polymerase sigma factor [Bacteroidetes bacterium]|nr:RNA polymerase sigma factor [Bacteroidota bacterium]